MVRDIVTVKTEEGKKILSTACSKVSTKDAASIVKDLIDTANYHNNSEDEETRRSCCGLAANQIGENKAVFIYRDQDGNWRHMINPVIINKSREVIESKEGCMSMDGVSIVNRHRAIEVFYQKIGSGRTYKEVFSGFTATIIQHEYDHLKGILI
ncbi:MAG: peptide deformylase [Bacilli bacterium]|nr:peptide deformylase [Bacilli bacterium]